MAIILVGCKTKNELEAREAKNSLVTWRENGDLKQCS